MATSQTQQRTSSIATVNPATNEVVREFPPMSTEAVDHAIERAHEAFLEWRELSVAERAGIVAKAGELMHERQDEFAKLGVLEIGKLYKESLAEVQLANSILDWYGANAEELLQDTPQELEDADAFVRYQPLGVILTVEPWNFPFYQAIRPAAPALVAGNTVLLKHASNNPQCALAVEQLFRDAGAPEGVYTNLFIPGREVAHVVEHPRVAAATLTGSDGAGSSIAEVAGKNLKKVVLELGGSDPYIILDDQDLEQTVKSAVAGRLANMGQICTSPKRFIVVEEAYDRFVDGVVEGFRAVKPGDPMDDATTLAPLSSEGAAKEVVEQVATAKQQGANVRLGGGRLDREGAWVEPTVITDITPAMDAFQDEIFGPVAMIYRAKDADDAVRIANESQYGLGATVMSHDVELGISVANRIESGMVGVNMPTTSQPQLPFGGVKKSGYGRELGTWGIREFVNEKLITVSTRGSKAGKPVG